MQEEKNTIAIVAGRGGYNELGLIRSCGEAGLKVILIAPNNMVIPIYKSKYLIGWYKEDIMDSEILLKTLNKIQKEYKNYEFIIFPASDVISQLLDQNYLEISKFAASPNAKGNLFKLMDKYEMSVLADKAGLKVPFFYRITLNANKLPEFEFPCIIKPLRSITGEKSDIIICKHKNTFNIAIKKYISKKSYDILIQSLVDGDNQEEVAVTGVSTAGGQIIIKGIVHKKRIRGNGSTVFAEYRDDLNKDLEIKIINFIKITKYQGIFDIEFLHNNDGYHFIECNFRNGAYGYAVTSAGFNLPYYFYQGSKNLIIDKPKIRSVLFMEERSDLLNLLDHTINFRTWVKDLFRTDTYLWWNKKDFMPLVRIPNLLKRIINSNEE